MNQHEWFRWFAWYPVKIRPEGRWVWWCELEYREVDTYDPEWDWCGYSPLWRYRIVE